MKIRTLSVTELNNYISKFLNTNPLLHNVSVSGEVFNYRKTDYGYTFFSLKDENSKINCILFRNIEKIPFKDGDHINVTGKVSIYEKNGTYSINIKDYLFEGYGRFYEEFQLISEELKELGYFDEEFKKPLPKYPARIGIITSYKGDAYKDIIKVLGKRYPFVEISVFDTKVQGEYAEQGIINGINQLNLISDLDFIILARGGGSYDELSIFNSKKIAHAIFESKIPIVSAIGHESDNFISDLVADLRASTPSSAIELCFPDINSVINQIDNNMKLLKYSCSINISTKKDRLYHIAALLEQKNPAMSILKNKYDLNHNYSQLNQIMLSRINSYLYTLEKFSEKLNSLNPLNILEKGYGIIDLDSNVINSINKVNIGDSLNITLSDGKLEVIVKHKFTSDGENYEKK